MLCIYSWQVQYEHVKLITVESIEENEDEADAVHNLEGKNYY